MKADIFYKRITILVALFGICIGLHAQETVSKKIEKSYAMTNSGKLHINNKYGDIIINGWSRSSIKVSVAIEVTHKKRENAEELIERINSNIKATHDFVSITSEINERSSGFFSKYFNKVNPFDLDKSNVKINYTIYMPTEAAIDLTNKFGDVILSDWNGKLKANVDHGDFWINNNLKNANISMRFGDLHAMEISYANLNLKNGTLDIEKSNKLQITSSGTTMEIGEINFLEVNSSKDDIVVQSVDQLQGDIAFSKIKIENLGETMDVYAKVADVNVLHISNSVPRIHIEQESSEVNINISETSLIFNATLEQGLLRIPKSFMDIHTNMINKGKKIREINATYGKAAYGEFVLTGLKGIIILKE